MPSIVKVELNGGAAIPVWVIVTVCVTMLPDASVFLMMNCPVLESMLLELDDTEYVNEPLPDPRPLEPVTENQFVLVVTVMAHPPEFATVTMPVPPVEV